MTYRIVGLTLSLAALLFGAAYTVLPSSLVVVRAINLIGWDETVALSERGRGEVLKALFTAELMAALPWLLLGVSLAMMLRIGLRMWQREPAPPASAKVVDPAGVEVELFGATFDHVPAMSRVKLAPMPASTLPAGATELQRQAFAAIAAVEGIPADVQGAHRESLLNHTRRIYDKAVELYGAASLEATAAVLHDLGKLLTYERRDGKWVETYPFHDNLTLIVMKRLPAFWRLTPDERARISSAMNVLCTKQTPADLEPELRTAVNAVRALDHGATRIEKAVADAPAAPAATEVDFSALCAAVRELPADMGSWNVNGRLRDAAPVEGWWLPDEPALLLPASRIRAWLARRVEPAMAQQLNLAQASTGTHAADAPIADALRNEGLLAEVVLGQQIRSGWWRSAVGRDQRTTVAALRGDRVPIAVSSRWGKPQKEVVLEPL